MAQWPGLLGGKKKLVGWLNKFLEKSRSRELKQVTGNGRLIESSDGLCVEIWGGQPSGQILALRVCKLDGSVKFLLFRMADTAEYDEDNLPEGTNIYDPTP